MEITPAIGVGAGDLLQAARAEVDSIVARTKGDVLQQSKLLIAMLRDRDLVTGTEVDRLTRLAEIDAQVGAGHATAKQAYFESRHLYNMLLADGGASGVALVLASSAVGSYSISDGKGGSDSVVFAKSDGHWANRGALTGAVIGSVWGPLGAAVGGAVGGAVGDVVDHCTKS
jgi:hypothetical protein